ncbi:MAG: putative baseplate assembly protein [Burkholderiales bacterium]|nr:putative baseplate assembly protein [Burkholderiales bacterium]
MTTLACSRCASTSLPCGCCAGVQPLTPAAIANRPGLPALAWRVGSHGRFLETMKSRLATMTVEGDAGPQGQPGPTLRPLAALTTRDAADPAIALLDGWATVADLLSFYTERIANEGYLGTATERRSVLELANLVGYKLRPGVAASVYLAYALDDNQKEAVTIAAGTRAQSLPGPGETPQSFETSVDLVARREWNDLQVRLQRPQAITLANALAIAQLFVTDSVSALRAGDPLLLLFADDGSSAALRSVHSTSGPDADGRSTIALEPVAPALAATVALLIALVADLAPMYAGADSATQRAIDRARELRSLALLDHDADPAHWAGDMINAADGAIAPAVQQRIGSFATAVAAALAALGGGTPVPITSPDDFVAGLLAPRVAQVANGLQLRRDLGSAFARGADPAPQMLLRFAPTLADSYYAAWAGARVNDAQAPLVGVHLLGTSASLFGAAVPRQATYTNGVLNPPGQWTEWTLDGETTDGLYLDQLYPSVSAPGYAVLRRLAGSEPQTQVLPIAAADAAQRSAYGISGKATRLRFTRDWWTADAASDMPTLRSTLVLAQSRPLTLAQEPLTDDVSGQAIELGALYDELESGRWVILSGERSDIPGVSGVQAAELMMVASLVHGYDATLPGDVTHTTLQLATPTAYAYKRGSLTIHGNVVEATHGETRNELLGSGDATQPWQTFTLKQPPLTYVSAATAEGAESTLAVYVDGVRWQETRSLAWLGPQDRGYVSAIADDGTTTVTFGDGTHGARLPTGVQNVQAVYRSGIGAPGDVQARQISLLATRPLGVSAVINPLRASGGADREDRDLARENAPLAVAALDRLVSVRDYADFARTYAGIAKASAMRASDGARELIYLTIAGVDDAPIDATGALYRNLVAALRGLGDADLPFIVAPRELKALVLSAGVAIDADRRWEDVAAAVRTTLLATFGFARRALGQGVCTAEVIAAIQGVRGVAWVDVDVLTAIPEKETAADGSRRLVTQPQITAAVQVALQGDWRKNGRRRAALPPDVVAFGGGRDRGGQLRPAELAIFVPDVPDTLILNPIAP